MMVIFTIYGLILWGLASALRRLGVPSRRVILLAFLLFAGGTGIWAALVWPLDSATLVNLPAASFGDALYQGAIRLIGDPASPQAHYTIPWVLRVPQVYVLASFVVWGPLGLGIQLVRNRWFQITAFVNCHRSGRANAKEGV